MNQYDLAIGTEVLCEGQVCGRLAKLVVDPHTRRVTDLIVQKGRLLRRDSVVPMAAVQEASKESINLLIRRDQLGDLPEYRPSDYEPAWAGQADREPVDEVIQLSDGIDTLYPELLLPMVRLRTTAAPAAGAITIERGHAVWGQDQRIGTIDHVLVDQSGNAKLVVVNRGPFSDGVILPMNLVTEITDTMLRTDLGEQDLHTLYPYRARDDVDVIVEVKERISRVIDAESIVMYVDGGVLRLSGMVADVRTKRRVEAAARAVLGVLDVQNDLDTGTALQARATEALAHDGRTALSRIEVAAGVGVVTLRGQVDAAEVRDAAGEIAASQDGVTAVINDLVVAQDQESAFLRLGTLAQCEVSFDEGLGQARPEKPVEKAMGRTFPVEISETKNAMTVTATVPGVRPEDIDLQAAGNTLTLTVMADDGADGPRPFCRRIVLPSAVDTQGMEAGLEGGVLTVRVPKQANPPSHKIEVKSTLAG